MTFLHKLFLRNMTNPVTIQESYTKSARHSSRILMHVDRILKETPKKYFHDDIFNDRESLFIEIQNHQKIFYFIFFFENCNYILQILCLFLPKFFSGMPSTGPCHIFSGVSSEFHQKLLSKIHKRNFFRGFRFLQITCYETIQYFVSNSHHQKQHRQFGKNFLYGRLSNFIMNSTGISLQSNKLIE